MELVPASLVMTRPVRTEARKPEKEKHRILKERGMRSGEQGRGEEEKRQRKQELDSD